MSKFELERVQGAYVSDQKLLADLKRAAQLAGTEILSQRLYSIHGQYDPTTASRRFGSWNKAVTAAGLQIANEKNIPDARLFENIMVLWEYYGRQPRRAELANPPSKISQGAYRRRFHSWMDSLAQFVDYVNAQELQPPNSAEVLGARQTGRDPSARMRFRVMTRDNFKCLACGISPANQFGVTLHIDHKKPWSLGGKTTDDNLQTLCDKCNLGKSNVL
ncbi:homing endonuclease associated repeat-containing protein [Acidocella sp.]|uniref:homing endonuclease associated repeat-containing protein n=1 Tax=Acidocella sp. TaxID=50710 RepID=UPI0026209F05|nr:HNH endonuclease [Acidocella sp.]